MDTKDITEINYAAYNPRTLSEHDGKSLDASMTTFGDISGITNNLQTNTLVSGHQRLRILNKKFPGRVKIQIDNKLDETDEFGTVATGYVFVEGTKLRFAYREVSWSLEKEKTANIAANRIEANWNEEMLAQINYELSQLENGQELLALTGQTQDEINKLLRMVSGEGGEGGEDEKANGSLSDNFIVPPFSVLDTKQGYWQNRKRAWLDIGIRSELGRAGEDGMGSIGGNGASLGAGLQAKRGADGKLEYAPILKEAKQPLTFRGAGADGDEDFMAQAMSAAGVGTSIFDPVLCEISYRWFSNEGASVLDPFAGGSVRGIVASKLGRRYTGLELRTEQVDANRVQATELCAEPLPVWVAGDSNKTLDTITETYDMIFSCPPYADLEVYSHDPDDLSNMPYQQFLEFYQSIITKSVNHLNNNKFIVWVIGEVRSKNGEYYNFVGDTITAFKNAGASYYNEMILLNSIGSLPMRASRAFNATRKIGKCHQNVLVFYKGDIKAIRGDYPELDFSALENMFPTDTEESPTIAEEPLV